MVFVPGAGAVRLMVVPSVVPVIMVFDELPNEVVKRVTNPNPAAAPIAFQSKVRDPLLNVSEIIGMTGVRIVAKATLIQSALFSVPLAEVCVTVTGVDVLIYLIFRFIFVRFFGFNHSEANG
jgi:hypothetical protein